MRIPNGDGRCALGRGCGSWRGAESSCPYVAVDGFSLVAYAEFLLDERKGICAVCMVRRPAFFEGLGVAVERAMTDNGPSRNAQFLAHFDSGIAPR